MKSEVGFAKTKVRLADMMSHLDLAQAQLELLALQWENKLFRIQNNGVSP